MNKKSILQKYMLSYSGKSGGGEDLLNALIDRSITSIESSATSIGRSAFASCSSLTNASFPNATSIDNSAFSVCSSLKNASFPNVTSIGNYTFSSCNNLQSIEIPKVTSMGDQTFYDNTSLENVTFSDEPTSIGSQTFYQCSNLRSIAGNVKSIGTDAFYYCTSLSLFDFRKATQVPTLSNTSAFYRTPLYKKIVVPDNLYDTWKTATNWSSTDDNIVSSIIKASDYEASL